MKSLEDFGDNSDGSATVAYMKYVKIEFTKAAMQGILANWKEVGAGELPMKTEELIAKMSIQQAESTLKELGL